MLFKKEEDVKQIVQERFETSTNQSLYPFIVIAGPITSPTSYYSVVGSTCYKLSSVLRAVQLTFQIFLTFGFSYPKEASHVWYFLQKVCFGMTVRGEKLLMPTNKALDFIEREEGVRFN